MICKPIIPDYEVNILDFGAVADGKTLATGEIANAIDACAGHGGGRVVIPSGLWLTGPILLKSNIELHLCAGAVVVFTPEYDQYPLRRVSLNGVRYVLVTAPIYGEDLENIAITGKGVFDGSGDHWRPVKQYKVTKRQWTTLVNSGGIVDETNKIWWPHKSALEGQKKLAELIARDAPLDEYGTVRIFMRPRLLSLINSKRIMIDGPTFQNSPMWNLHPLLCQDILIRNISIRNLWYSQNGDGLDLESCKNVVVEDSIFDVGDDAICLKSGRDEIGRKIGVPTENIIVRNCKVYHGHGGFVVGSEMSGGVHNAKITNCQFMGTDVGLRFKSRRGRGGIVEDIIIENIDMIDVKGPAIMFDLFYGGNSTESKSVSVKTPEFKNISFKNICCRGADIGIYLRGLPEMPLKNLKFEQVAITADQGTFIEHSVDHIFADVMIEDEEGKVLFNS